MWKKVRNFYKGKQKKVIKKGVIVKKIQEKKEKRNNYWVRRKK